MRWTEEAADRCTVEDVAAELGWQVWSKAGARGFPCPEHPDPHTDGRPTGRIVHGGRAFYCHRGAHGGGPVSLVSWHMFGAWTVRGEQFHAVRAWFAARGWCTPWQGGERRARVPVAPPVRPVVPSRATPPRRLPSGEVEALWDACARPHLADGVDPWLYVRGLDCRRVAALDLARVVSPGQPSPKWAGFAWQDRRTGETRRKSWADAGWRLLLPIFDSGGRMVALRARWTGWADPAGSECDPMDPTTYPDDFVETPPPFSGKEISPRGEGACVGTVYADPVGRWLLGGRVGCIDPDAPDLEWSGDVLVVEGGPAWLQYCTAPGRVSEDGRTMAVFGVWPGAWTNDEQGRAIARRCKGARSVLVACDDDNGGDQIGRPILAALRSVGCTVAATLDYEEVARENG